jgi:hypothetical protein
MNNTKIINHLEKNRHRSIDKACKRLGIIEKNYSNKKEFELRYKQVCNIISDEQLKIVTELVLLKEKDPDDYLKDRIINLVEGSFPPSTKNQKEETK